MPTSPPLLPSPRTLPRYWRTSSQFQPHQGDGEYIDINLPENITFHRQILRKCQYCNETFVCKCRLEAHKLEHHFIQHNTEFLDKLSKEVLCPHCCQILENKCRLLRHIFLEHPAWAGPAMIALKERSHFYEWGLAAITSESRGYV